MQYLTLAISPMLVAIGIATSPRMSLRAWISVIGLIASAEGLAFWNLGNRSSLLEFLGIGVFVIVLPWAASTAALWLCRYPQRPLLLAVLFPIAYFSAFFLCLAAAINVFPNEPIAS